MKLARTSLRTMVLVLVFLPFGQSSMATSQTDDFPKHLLGQWSGEGRSMGMDSRPRMSWERVLADKFVHLHFRNEMKNAQGKTEVFEGHAYYKTIGAAKFSGNWFDSGGAAHPIRAVFENNVLTALWGTEETQMGRTIYRIVNDSSVEIVDSVRLNDGTWREFSRTLLKRI